MSQSRPGYDDVHPLPRGIIVLLIALALALVAAGAGIAYFYVTNRANGPALATAQAGVGATTTTIAASRATATAQASLHGTATAIGAANATATAQAVANATATAQASVAATATIVAANPDPYPPGGGKLALLDPLRDNSGGYNWLEGTANCVFSGGAYHVIAPDARFFNYCLARSTDFSNFSFEVQMKIVKGDVGGLVFRANGASNMFYLFYVTEAGYYELFVCSGGPCKPIVPTTASTAIRRGLNQVNLLAVVATGPSIALFVNRQEVARLNNSVFAHGQIGVVASPFATAGHPTEVVYSNARVWTL